MDGVLHFLTLEKLGDLILLIFLVQLDSFRHFDLITSCLARFLQKWSNILVTEDLQHGIFDEQFEKGVDGACELVIDVVHKVQRDVVFDNVVRVLCPLTDELINVVVYDEDVRDSDTALGDFSRSFLDLAGNEYVWLRIGIGVRSPQRFAHDERFNWFFSL